jgi:hypothetical protein
MATRGKIHEIKRLAKGSPTLANPARMGHPKASFRIEGRPPAHSSTPSRGRNPADLLHRNPEATIRFMSSPPPVRGELKCQFQRTNGEFCKRGVAPGETKCWQHANSWAHKWKSLTRNQSIAFICILLGVGLGVPSLYFSYVGSRGGSLSHPPLVTIQISPSSFPIFALPHSTISILPLHPYRTLTDAADYLTKYDNDCGEEHFWPTKKEIDSKAAGDYETVFKVEITNHSQETLLSCKTTFRLRYNAGLQGGGCMPPKDNSKDQEDVVLVPPLDPGKSFQFFAVNQSNLCVWLIPPAFATVKMAGDATERQAGLTFDKNPLYFSGAPVFPPTRIRWEGVPSRPGGYGIGRSSAACKGAPQSTSALKERPGKSAATRKNGVDEGAIQQTKPSPARPIDTDVHRQLVTGRLALGWTLHRRGGAWTISLIMDNDQLGAALTSAIDRGDLNLDGEPAAKSRALWSEIRLEVPAPKPAETEYGIVKDQEFVEHITHYFGREQDGLQWTYEIMQNGSGITPKPQVSRTISMGDLSSGSQETVSEMDKLAIRTVNRRYIDAMVKISK